jgi:hypothetical protein
VREGIEAELFPNPKCSPNSFNAEEMEERKGKIRAEFCQNQK